MEELFRFTLTRPADRTSATTLPLERKTAFQDAVTSAASHVGADQWSAMQDAALTFVKSNLTWIVACTSQAPPPPLPALKQLLTDLQSVQADSEPTAWQTPLQTASNNTNATQLSDWNGKLADLFLALLILRSIGPAAIDRLIRVQNLTASFAEILHDRPSLDEVANLLRMIDLVTNASIPIKTADDLQAVLTRTLLLPPGIFSRFEKPVHAVGFTDLLVVKQHIARYELGEVARIENILKGESRDHAQKHTLSNERDTVLETSTQTETDQELTTTDHVSLQNEIENTLKEDTKVDAGVHVQYDGGSVKAQADLTVGYDRSSSESKKFASNIAKDITQKAAKKVTQKVQQTITTKIIETFEETEDQSFDNKTGPANISGVYQWVEKVYLAQVFKYGKHMLFDIMVPEPAASLLQAATTPPPDQKLPVQPDPLGKFETDTNGVKQLTEPLKPDQLVEPPPADPKTPRVFGDWYGDWVAKYQVSGVEPPPPATITVSKSISQQAASDNNVHFQDTITLDDGYMAHTWSVSVAWKGRANSDPPVDVMVGTQILSWGPKVKDPNQNPNFKTPSPDHFTGFMQGFVLPDEEGSVAISLAAVFSEEVAANIEVQCVRTEKRFAKWQFQTYEKIVAAWQKLQSDYEEKISALQFQKGTTGPLGAADPDTNRQIERTELKRSCIALLNNSYSYINGSDALVPKTSPPAIPPTKFPYLFDPDVTVSETIGSWVRWFEQAFEWDKIGYVFYPYYWGRSSQWADKLFRKQDDPLFLNFLQAGYARVVIPVRNGFEFAMNFFLLTGRPWMGGGLPAIWDKGQNPLYLSIIEEIKELTGGPTAYEEESLSGDPWEIRLPATLIKLRDDEKLPMWKWDPPGTSPPPGTYPPSPSSLWTWSEDKAGEQNE